MTTFRISQMASKFSNVMNKDARALKCLIVCSTEQPLKIEVAKNLDNPFVVDSFSSLCFLIQLVFNSLRIPEHIESNRNIILTSF